MCMLLNEESRGWHKDCGAVPSGCSTKEDHLRHLPTLAAAVLAGLFLIAGTGLAFAGEPTVLGIRLGVDSQRTRVVLDLSEPLTPQVMLLSGPDRLVIDLPKVDWKAPDSANTRVGLVKGFRFGRVDSNTYRLVLDLGGPTDISGKFSLPPGSGYKDRYVIDLKAVAAPPRNSVQNQPDIELNAGPEDDRGRPGTQAAQGWTRRDSRYRSALTSAGTLCRRRQAS